MRFGQKARALLRPAQNNAKNSMVTHEQVNILMVDDQPGKLLSYEVMLAPLGENLIKATSAKQALETLLKTGIAVVLMDVSMPDLDGFQLAAMIRQHPRFQRTAIIFISAVHLTDLDSMDPRGQLRAWQPAATTDGNKTSRADPFLHKRSKKLRMHAQYHYENNRATFDESQRRDRSQPERRRF